MMRIDYDPLLKGQRLARSVCKKNLASACKTFYARTFAKILHLEKAD
jgi:hypothetical protein